MTLAFYISGHGFGHASRQVEIINALAGRVPDVRIIIRSSVARWLLDRTLRVPFTLDPTPCDTGVVQIDSLRLDAGATIDRARAFYDTFDERVAREAALLREANADLVIADAPPLGCAASAAAGVPCVVIANFTWDWIYSGYPEELRRAPGLLPIVQNAYRQASEAWRLPLHGGFSTFDRIIDVPFVARHGNPSLSRDDVLRALHLPFDRPVALVSFGGYGTDGVALDRLDCLDAWTVVLTGRPEDRREHGHLRAIADDDIYEAGLRYADLVRAADAVVTKPGYGIVSECIANGTAIAYTSRGHFVEYDVLVREMPRYLRSAFLDQDDLFSGRWRGALDAAVSAPPPAERPATNGAGLIASLIATARSTDRGGAPSAVR